MSINAAIAHAKRALDIADRDDDDIPDQMLVVLAMASNALRDAISKLEIVAVAEAGKSGLEL